MEMNEKAILQFIDLDISFRTNAGVVHAIRGVNIELRRGETVAIVGESGSGKSVTVKAAVGLLDGNATVNSGKILYRCKEADGSERVVDLLAMSRRELRRTINGSHIAMVTDAEKRMKNYPHQLSGGMRQRVVIAIALASDPDILICDEPTTALDVTIQARILELIKDVQRRLGLSVIYITHDLGVVAKVADYVNVMYAGKIIEVGTVNEIFYEPKHPYTWGLLAAMPDLETDDDRLVSIPGSPPNLLHEPVGDAFAPRNALALKIDEKADPPMFQITETHYAATWLLHPDAPKVEMPQELKERIERSRKEAELYL